MLTLLLYGLVAVILGCALFLVAAVLLPAGEQIAPSIRDEPPWDLPTAHRLEATDVAGVRLPVALRGYRFAETDLLLDRLADELRERDLEIMRLRGPSALEPVAPEGTATPAAQPAADQAPAARLPAGEPDVPATTWTRWAPHPSDPAPPSEETPSAGSDEPVPDEPVPDEPMAAEVDTVADDIQPGSGSGDADADDSADGRSGSSGLRPRRRP